MLTLDDLQIIISQRKSCKRPRRCSLFIPRPLCCSTYSGAFVVDGLFYRYQSVSHGIVSTDFVVRNCQEFSQ